MKIEENKYSSGSCDAEAANFRKEESPDMGGLIYCSGTFVPPSEEDKGGDNWKLLDRKMMTKPQEKLAEVIANKEDFIVYGESGWGKTEMIEEYAHKCGLTVISVNIFSATEYVLDGFEDAYKQMPSFAAYLMQHPDTQFLLLFDFLNWAPIRTMNALRSLILTKTIRGVKFDNFFVGATGNYAFESSSVKELPDSLKSCMTEIIWECRTKEAWAEHFAWAHKNWDDKCGAELINKCEKLKDYWASPRSLTLNVYGWVAHELKNPPLFATPEDIAEDLIRNVVYSEVDMDSPKLREDIRQFSEWVYNYIKKGGKSDD